MEQDNEQPVEKNEENVFQDGVSCPKLSPWPLRSALISGVMLLAVFGVGAYVLYQVSLLRLLIWLLAAGIFALPLRYLVCARCPYYGQSCSTVAGKIVPLIFAKQEFRSMKLGLWMDVVMGLFLFAFPFADMWAYGGWMGVSLWIVLVILVFLILSRVGCNRCPFTFCPIGKLGGFVWNFLDGGKNQ